MHFFNGRLTFSWGSLCNAGKPIWSLNISFFKKLFSRAPIWCSVTLKFNCVICVWTTNHFAEPYHTLGWWHEKWSERLRLLQHHSDLVLDQIGIECYIDGLILTWLAVAGVAGTFQLLIECWKVNMGAGMSAVCLHLVRLKLKGEVRLQPTFPHQQMRNGGACGQYQPRLSGCQWLGFQWLGFADADNVHAWQHLLVSSYITTTMTIFILKCLWEGQV